MAEAFLAGAPELSPLVYFLSPFHKHLPFVSLFLESLKTNLFVAFLYPSQYLASRPATCRVALAKLLKPIFKALLEELPTFDTYRCDDTITHHVLSTAQTVLLSSMW
jgi:hypothetical protein